MEWEFGLSLGKELGACTQTHTHSVRTSHLWITVQEPLRYLEMAFEAFFLQLVMGWGWGIGVTGASSLIVLVIAKRIPLIS